MTLEPGIELVNPFTYLKMGFIILGGVVIMGLHVSGLYIGTEKVFGYFSVYMFVILFLSIPPNLFGFWFKRGGINEKE